MQRYYCLPDVFYAEVDPDGSRRRDVAGTIGHLVDCYGLAGRSVISVGAGRAVEEFHFLQRGCSLTLFDDDSEGTVGGPIQRSASSHPTRMTYWLGDFTQWRGEAKADILYFSGFAPDEMHRERITRLRPGFLFWPFRWRRHPLLPFDRSVIAAAREMLNDNGLLLIQSYCGGVDHTDQRAFIPGCAAQLADAGLRLLDVYCFEHTIGVKLFAAVKGTDWPRRELTAFHGRSQLKEGVTRIYGSPAPAGDETVFPVRRSGRKRVSA